MSHFPSPSTSCASEKISQRRQKQEEKEGLVCEEEKRKKKESGKIFARSRYEAD